MTAVRGMLLLGVCVLLAAAAAVRGAPAAADEAAAAENATRPNIVLIMTDDQGYGDLGVTGNPVIETPHLDAMAARSASASAFWVSPVCAPTRASLMTGRYNYRTRVVDTYVGRAMMAGEEVTVAEILRDAGYATGIFGKWHLGDCHPLRPQDQGFDEVLVHRGGGIAQPSEPLANERRYTDAILYHNGEEVQTKGYCTDVYFDAGMAWMEKVSREDRPFFAYVATNSPHGPFHDVPADLYAKYRAMDLSPILLGNERTEDTVARVAAMVENIDQNVGRLFERLRALDLFDDTLVIFLVDNGPNTRRYVAGLRGMKASVYEGGIRSPLFAHWPARLPAGGRCEAPAAHIDLLPTLVEAAGVALPAGLELDGRSLLPLLEGKQVEWPERTICIQTHRGDAPVRYHHFAARRGKWKLVRASGFGREAPPDGAPFELYDLSADPGEMNDLAAENPEVLARLKSDYDAWFDDVSSTRLDNYAPPRIVAGTDAERETCLTKQDWRRLEGGGWGDNGRWLLRVAHEAVFDVRAILEEPLAGTAELRLGKRRERMPLFRPVSSFVFENVRLPEGPLGLELVVIDAEGSSRGAYQVVLARR